MHGWITYAGLISTIWIKITIWEPELSKTSAWALQSHESQCSCMQEAMYFKLYLCGLSSVSLALRMKASSNPTFHCSRAAYGTHTQPGQHCELWDTHSEDWVIWRPACTTQACPFLWRKSWYRDFYLGFIRVYLCGIVVNTACQIAKPSSRKKGHTAFERKRYQKVIRTKQFCLKFPRNSQPEEETQHRALNKGLVWKVCEVW